MADWKKFVDNIVEYFHSLGINPIYPSVLVIFVIAFFSTKKIKKWYSLRFFEKAHIILSCIAAVLALIGLCIALLSDFKIIK